MSTMPPGCLREVQQLIDQRPGEPQLAPAGDRALSLLRLARCFPDEPDIEWGGMPGRSSTHFDVARVMSPPRPRWCG